MQIVIGISKTARWAEGDKLKKDWKKPFKKLKLSKVRAEDEWHILLDVDESEVKKIYSLTDGRMKVETVMEETVTETWEEKTSQLGQNVDIKA